MNLFWNSNSAPSTLQYQSIISWRRLVCSTRCESFFGDAMTSSERHALDCGSVHPIAAQVNCEVNDRMNPIIDENVARRDFFYIGGEYAGEPGQEIMHGQMYEVMHGQMYVERLTARERRRPYPL